MTRPLVVLGVVLATVLDGCASTQSGTPAQPASASPVDTTYLALTRYKGCQSERGPFFPAGRSAVVRYYNRSTDSVLHPFRIITGSETGLCLPAAVALGSDGELFVLNQAPTDESRDSAVGRWERWVTVYDSSASGDATPVRALHVQSSWLGHPSVMYVDREGNLLLGSRVGDVVDEGSVAVFEAGADGDAEPVRVIAGAATGLRRPAALAIDRRGFVYVANSQGDRAEAAMEALRRISARRLPVSPWKLPPDRNAVLVFAPGVGSDVAPSRVIAGERTGLSGPMGLALDRRDRLYVANHEPLSGRYAVTVYDPSASGDTAPARRLTDNRGSYGMGQPERVIIDSHDSVFVGSERNHGSQRTLTVFARADTTAPSRSFFRNAPRLFTIDRHDTLYTLAGDSVKVFPPGYAGAGSPVRAIGGPHTGIRSVAAMMLDREGRLYLAVGDSSIIRVYPPGASGDVTPARTLAGPHTRLAGPKGIAVDRDGRVYVTNGQRRSGGGGAIRVYASGARGEDPPVRTLVGPDVPLPQPDDIARDSHGDLYVAASNEKTGGQVLVLQPRGERLDTAVRTLVGPSTLLRRPIALALGRGDTLYALNVFGAFATVTVYAPGAGGEAEPVRAIDVLREGKNPRLKIPLAALRDLVVDTTGAIQVWTADGAVVYPPGGAGAPSWVTLQQALDGDRGAVTVAGDGVVYQAIGPIRNNRFFGSGLVVPGE